MAETDSGISALLAETRRLSGQVERLGDRLTVSQTQVQRTKGLTRWVLLLAMISLIGVFATGILLFQVRDAVDTNEQNAITTCKNANETRKANAVLWNFVLDVSEKNNTGDETTTAYLEAIRGWVNELYAPRDCNNLDKEYPIPEPPSPPVVPSGAATPSG